MDDNTLNELLKSRHTPQAPSNLAHRIADAAQNDVASPRIPSGAQERRPSLDLSWLFRPQPAFALATVALIIIGAGVFTLDLASEQTQTSDDVSLAFYVDDILGAEDFL